MKNPVKSFLMVLIVATLAGCASSGVPGGRDVAKTGPGGIPLDASPEERAVAKWRLLINREFAEAWEFQTPGARCDTEDSCLVSLEVPFQVGLGRGVGTVTAPSFIAERWLRLDGAWYYAPAELSAGDLRPPE
jgi:hypothetical protein